LKRARALGTHLTVALPSDIFNQLKGKDAKFSWEQRKLDLEGVRYVDDIISKDECEQKVSEVVTHNIDLFTIGDDWERKFDFLKEHCYAVYLGRTQKISSTMILKLSRTIGGWEKSYDQSKFKTPRTAPSRVD
jgi:glycerol-3-phosphate cytidylyltransferase